MSLNMGDEKTSLSRFAQQRGPFFYNFIVQWQHQVSEQAIMGESNETELKRKKKRYKAKLGDLNIFL